MSEPQQPKFLLKAKETFKIHRSKILSEDKWNTTDTARFLRRSIGGVSEDLMIARWCRTHENSLEKFKYAYEALEFIREKQAEQEKREIE